MCDPSVSDRGRVVEGLRADGAAPVDLRDVATIRFSDLRSVSVRGKSDVGLELLGCVLPPRPLLGARLEHGAIVGCFADVRTSPFTVDVPVAAVDVIDSHVDVVGADAT